MASGRFIPTSELRRLSEGCYEHVIYQVDALVKENAARIFGRDAAFEVVGTFPTAALVLSEDGTLVRVMFRRSEKGALVLTQHALEKVRAFTNETVEDFARSEIKRAVKLWREGRVREAQTLIAEVAPYVADRPVKDDAKIVEALITAYRAPRPWKHVFQKHESASRIRVTVGNAALLAIKESAPEVKFRMLYEGGMGEAERQGYASLLYTDFEYLRARIGSLFDAVEECYEPLRRVVGSEEFKEEKAIQTLAVFSEDLIADLRRLHQVVTDAPKQIMKIESLAQFYDAIVEGWANYEVAGKFVETMSKRLTEAVTN